MATGVPEETAGIDDSEEVTDKEDDQSVPPDSEGINSNSDQNKLDSYTTTPQGQTGEQFEEDRLKRTVFVGNISLEAKAVHLRRLFKPYGRIETVRIRNIIPESPNVPKKVALLAQRMSQYADSFSAFVVFAETENVENVVSRACTDLHFKELLGKHIRVTPACQTVTGPKRKSAFIGNLPFDCTEEEFITTFLAVAKELGTNLLNVRLNRDQDTGVGRGIGFVTLSDEIAVQALINKSGDISIRNNTLRISAASKREHSLSTTYKRRKMVKDGKHRRGVGKPQRGFQRGGRASTNRGGGNRRWHQRPSNVSKKNAYSGTKS